MTRPLSAVCLIALLCAAAAAATAQTSPAARPTTKPTSQPFQNEIEAFEAADRAHPPTPGSVMFLGSSSIRLWKTLAEDFPDLRVVNRGFGGSTVPDSTRYADRVVVPHRPRLIVYYEGDNDIAAGHSPERVLADFKAFVSLLHERLPETRLLFISIKPSPSRAKVAAQAKEANRLVREFIASDPKLAYVDVWTPMLGTDGQPREELFGPDRLHMNRKGYELWASILRPLVK
jgi:lysophospholipase L1-like esterase